jgi:hypothetical protein
MSRYERESEKAARELFSCHATFHEDFQRLRWFLLPQEAKNILEKFGKFLATPTCEDRLKIRFSKILCVQ